MAHESNGHDPDEDDLFGPDRDDLNDMGLDPDDPDFNELSAEGIHPDATDDEDLSDTDGDNEDYRDE